MPVKVSFADLTHTGQIVAANTFPLGISMVTAYAKQELGDEIEAEIFKYPDDFADYLDKGLPDIACFSSFSWNVRLGHEYAQRIKEASPKTATVFGGPNFPDTPDEQEQFLKNFPMIDFFFEFEGELSFVAFFKALKEIDFDWQEFKRTRSTVQNIRYLADGEFVAAPLAPKISDLSILPSPHLTGISDKFYDGVLNPMIQTTRGCPYHCAFCWEGGSYFRKTLRFDQERVKQELRYMSERVGTVLDLQIVDANFGMFSEDLDTAGEILAIQKEHENGWPQNIGLATAKNHKERTIEIVELLGKALPAKGAVQSTDAEVLANIGRKNPPMEALINMATAVEESGGHSEAEMILCLEGETKEKHFKTVFDMLDANFGFIRMYQFMMLPGTRSSSKEHRTKYGFETRFRVLPRCFGTYRFGNENFPSAEIEEIVVTTNTMPYEDYQACRDLNLTVETFANDAIFIDLMKFLARWDIGRSDFILAVYNMIAEGGGSVASMYADFREEEKRNLWADITEIEAFIKKKGVIERYIDAEFGTNELYKYRALAVFEHLEALHEIVFGAARKLLDEQGALDEDVEDYLRELSEFSLLRKTNTLDTDRTVRRTFHYDFTKLLESRFSLDPFEVRRVKGVEVEVYHSEEQSMMIESYTRQYTTSLVGLGRIMLKTNFNRLYRSARTLGEDGASTPPSGAKKNSSPQSDQIESVT